jgi:alkanesulfonate monooxygenase SsuD/methylene tetrahydromethanopterin reductase-like flavin-dependent oxidoreductase (luciferase family)
MKVGILTFAVDVATLAPRADTLGFDTFGVPEHTATPVHIALETTTYRLHLEPDGPPTLVSLWDLGRALDHPGASLGRDLDVHAGDGCMQDTRAPSAVAGQAGRDPDRFSGGRFVSGIGVGWLDVETEIMGGELAHRWDQTREAILARNALWSKDAEEFHGRAMMRTTFRFAAPRGYEAAIRWRWP